MSAERPWGILSLFTTCVRLRVNSHCQNCDTDTYVASLWSRSFFLQWKSLRTPPLEGTSLHRRINYECGETLGDLEPVYDLFSITSDFGLPEAVTLWNKARGESGDSYVHSSRTPHIKETWVWRDLGKMEGSWACLRPVSDHQKPTHKHVIY